MAAGPEKFVPLFFFCSLFPTLHMLPILLPGQLFPAAFPRAAMGTVCTYMDLRRRRVSEKGEEGLKHSETMDAEVWVSRTSSSLLYPGRSCPYYHGPRATLREASPKNSS
ncbi:hypothetical protein L209DRAFT_80758 [Thermothelomyces heterothallicus CBS 203.75]